MSKKNQPAICQIADIHPARPKCVLCGGKLKIRTSRQDDDLRMIYRYCECEACGQANVYREKI